MDDDRLVLRVSGLTKSYGSVVALKGVEFGLRRGEVMALLGENGAGKSTLVKILAGLEHPDAGQIEIDGRPARLRSPSQSLQAGVAYVTQELSIISALSVAENICLGGRSQNPIWTASSLAQRVKPYLDLVGLGDVDPATTAGKLSVAQRQLVEIARLLSRDAGSCAPACVGPGPVRPTDRGVPGGPAPAGRNAGGHRRRRGDTEPARS